MSTVYCESLRSLCSSIVIPFISFERPMLCVSNSIAITNSVAESGQPGRTSRSDEGVLRRIRHSKHN